MIFILLSWLYITCILYLNGSLFLDVLKKLFRIDVQDTLHFTTVSITGIAFTTILTCILCLLIPLNLVANIIILAIALLYLFFNYKKIKHDIRYYISEAKKTPLPIKILFFCYLLTISVVSNYASSHYDDGLYYSPSIKWLQEYGTVPGLGNLNPRIAFNSSWLILQSLFGFPFLSGGRVLNDLNGLLYILVFIYTLQGLTKLLRGDRTFFTFLQAFFFLPALALHFTASHDFILYNVNLFSSPSSDVPAGFIMWIIFLLFLEPITGSLANLKLIITVILICCLLTIKLSTIPIILLTLPLLWRFLVHKKFGSIAAIGLIASGAIVPWLIRNIILSGYLIFPFAKIDIFNFDWKVPIVHVQYHENAVRIWAINPEYDLGGELKAPFSEWFPGWFDRLTYIQSVVIILICAFSLIWAVIFFYKLFTQGFRFIKNDSRAIIFIITSLAGILFWFYKGPDMRLGFGFCLFFCMYGISAFIRYFIDSFPKQIAITLITIAFAVFIFSYSDIWTNAPLKRLVTPLTTYPLPQKVDSVNLSPTVTLYLSGNEPCKNCPLPCAWGIEYGVFQTVLRGKTLKEGFRSGNQKPFQ